MALGAERHDIIRMVLRESFAPVFIGIVLGLAAALALTFALARFVGPMLFNVTARDPWTIVVTSTFLLVAAGLAAFLPARRASRISPTAALKYE